MAVTKFTEEIKVRALAKRMYKAVVTEPYTYLPKIMPDLVKSVEMLQGDGRTGTIKQTNFHDGSPYPYLKNKIEELDTDNYAIKYTLIEGAILGDKVESIYYDIKFEDTSDGGCIIKIASEYRTKGDIRLKAEDVKAGKDQFLTYYRLTEEYLLAYPEVCA